AVNAGITPEEGWQQVRELDRRLAAGEIDAATWHRELTGLVTRTFLAAPSVPVERRRKPRPLWSEARRPLLNAIEKDGTFLDVGCGSGLLMEMVQQWGLSKDLLIEPYGVEISAELAELARSRNPQWAGRIFWANV